MAVALGSAGVPDPREARARAARSRTCPTTWSSTSPATHVLDVRVRTTVWFSSTVAETFLELADATDLALTVNDEPVAHPAYDGTRIAPGRPRSNRTSCRRGPAALRHRRRRHARLHRPGRRRDYVSAYFGMDIAQKVFACFDQNDLKAPVTLTVHAPTRSGPCWPTAGCSDAGRRAARPSPRRRRSRWRCSWSAPGRGTPSPGSTPGCPFGWHARRSLARRARPRRRRAARRPPRPASTTTRRSSTSPTPSTPTTRSSCPARTGARWRRPGCVTYRDEYLPRGRITDRQRAARATMIAHEMAHMWFGDLVTMTWWEDTWLQESFADYMGYRVAETAAGYAGHAGRLRGAPQARGLRRRRAPLDPPGRPRGRGRAGRRRGLHQLRHDLLRQGQRRPAPAGHLARRRGLPRRASTPTCPGTASATPPSPTSWPRSTPPPTATSAAGSSVAAHHRLRHDPGRARRRGTRCLHARGSAAAPLAGRGVRRRSWPSTGSRTGRPRRRAGAARRVARPGRRAQHARRDLRPGRAWTSVTRAVAVDAGLSAIEDDAGAGGAVGLGVRPGAHAGSSTPGRLPRAGRRAPAASSRTSTIVTAVLRRTLARRAPRGSPPDERGHAYDTLADACAQRAGRHDRAPSWRWPSPRAGATTGRDAALLHGLAGRRTDRRRRRPGPRAALAVVHRLAAARRVRRRDDRGRAGAATGRRPAARRRLRPGGAADPEAKEEAWAALAADDPVSNRLFEAWPQGCGSPSRPTWWRRTSSATSREAPALAERRGQAFAQVVGRAFPPVALSRGAARRCWATRWPDDVPTVLRRDWEDQLRRPRLHQRSNRAGPAAAERSGVAVEHRGDRAVLEDLADRARDQRRDREHGQLVELPVGGDRQRVGDDRPRRPGCS